MPRHLQKRYNDSLTCSKLLVSQSDPVIVCYASCKPLGRALLFYAVHATGRALASMKLGALFFVLFVETPLCYWVPFEKYISSWTTYKQLLQCRVSVGGDPSDNIYSTWKDLWQLTRLRVRPICPQIPQPARFGDASSARVCPQGESPSNRIQFITPNYESPISDSRSYKLFAGNKHVVSLLREMCALTSYDVTTFCTFLRRVQKNGERNLRITEIPHENCLRNEA